MNSILTIGYGKRSRAELLDCLRKYKVTHLVDVRSVPFSEYHSEFNKPELAVALANGDLKYVFLGDKLGGRPSERSCYDEADRVVYDLVEELDSFKEGINQLVKAASVEGRVLCMMCSESKPETCHRSKLIGKVLQERNIAVHHITESGSLAKQAEVLRRIDDGQLNLFGEQLTSRKGYASSGK